VLLTPRYHGPAVLRFDSLVGQPSTPLLRQRRRVADVLATLDPEQWAWPSRCAGWSAQDVVAHLVHTNQAWEASITAGLAGAPTRMFRSFDPVATPPRLVEAMRGWTPSAVLARFEETTESLASVVDGLDDAAWSLTGESPLGHVGLAVVALHGLWDSWVHERDVLLPLGMAPVEEPDEVAACLRYSVALGPAALATGGSTRRGTLAVDATDPDVQFVVEAGSSVLVRDGVAAPDAARLAGPAVTLIDGLTSRAPLTAQVTGTGHWMLSGLAAAFDIID
jgi:uncharacterized protein (TIGR03083 family)